MSLDEVRGNGVTSTAREWVRLLCCVSFVLCLRKLMVLPRSPLESYPVKKYRTPTATGDEEHQQRTTFPMAYNDYRSQWIGRECHCGIRNKFYDLSSLSNCPEKIKLQLCLALEVFQDHMLSFTVFSKVGDGNTAGIHDFAGFALLV